MTTLLLMIVTAGIVMLAFLLYDVIDDFAFARILAGVEQNMFDRIDNGEYDKRTMSDLMTDFDKEIQKIHK